MKTPIYLSDAVGKTLTACEWQDSRALLVFGEEYVVVQAEQDYDESPTLECRPLSVEDLVSRGEGRLLLRVGILNQEELDAILLKRKQQMDQRYEQHQREQYEKLKQLFGERP